MARGGPSGGSARRACLATALIATALPAGVAACGEGDDPVAQVGPNAPNFVVVMSDDQDVASMAAMPTTRREIGERGVDFTNSYVALSECCPSRATFLT